MRDAQMRPHAVFSDECTGLSVVGPYIPAYRLHYRDWQTQCSNTDREGVARIRPVTVGCKAKWHRKAIGDRIGARRL